MKAIFTIKIFGWEIVKCVVIDSRPLAYPCPRIFCHGFTVNPFCLKRAFKEK